MIKKPETDKCWICGHSKKQLDDWGIALSSYIIAPARSEPPIQKYEVCGCEICFQLVGGLHGISQ